MENISSDSSDEILKNFMSFVRREYLHELAKTSISLNKNLDIPLMRYFTHLSDTDLFNLSCISLDEFLKGFEEGKAYDAATRNLTLWENDELPGISKESIEPSDLVLITISQKKALFTFIPKFTTDILTAFKIVEALEDYYMITQDAAFNLYTKMKANAQQQAASLKAEHEALLQQQVYKLELSNKELEAFSYSVSHDLRAPLRHIDGFIDLLRKNSLLDEKNNRYLNIISDSARHMGNLIDELLAFSRLGNVEIRKTKVDMNELVKEVIKNLESDFIERDIVWKISSLPDIEGDKNLIKQVFVNLISNALKYTSKRKQAIIEIGTDFNGSEPVFFIKDNGAGFNMKYVEKLFGIFQRLHRNNEFEGIGIGLANVKRIITKHNGKVWAEGNVNEGASFFFTVPAG